MQTSTTNPFTEEFTIIETTPIADQGNLPVIRVDRNGKILFANKASLSILNEILKSTNDYIPQDFVERIPGMLNLNADFSVPVEVSSQTMMFDVIGFEECGYIGLYGYISSPEKELVVN